MICRKDIRRKKKILLILIIISLCFIWIHSAVPAAESYEESGLVLKVIQKIFGDRFSDHIVRKAAHFLEYAVLGSLLTVFSLYHRMKRKAVFVWMIGGLAALLDETIQIFSGRNAQVSDVLLDLSGVIFAFVAVLIVHQIDICRSGGQKY